jgi:hypothetical protein
MYRLRVKRGFATILKNEKEIEPLSGLLVVGNELAELQELVNLANQAAAQQSFAPDGLTSRQKEEVEQMIESAIIRASS